VSARELLTPKQVASAIGVSESSLKRWCDRGVLSTVRTAGGHRRIPLHTVLKYLHESGQPLVAPEVLGLPRVSGPSDKTLQQACDELVVQLLDGRSELCRRLIFELYLGGHHLATICDEVIQPAFVEIGRRWECGTVQVYQERVACEMTQRVLTELQLAWSRRDPQMPLAIGGTAPGDESRLPMTMCELILSHCGWRATSLGTNLPFASLESALVTHKPKLLWLGCSHACHLETFIPSYRRLIHRAQDLGVAVVIGGRAFDAGLRQQLSYTAFCENMRQFQEFAESWIAAEEHGKDGASGVTTDAHRLAL